jgi:hypothetical protein
MLFRGFQVALFAAAIIGAAGCGGAGKKDSEDRYVTVCEDRALTGSEINRVRCRRKDDVDERKRRDSAFMQRLQNETPRRQIGAPPSQ